MNRHVKARTFDFLAAVPPQFSPECLKEAEALDLRNAVEVSGGVEFSGRLPECYRANLRMAVPTRIWLLWHEFGVGATEQLFSKTLSIPWDCFLDSKIPLRVSARVRNSRIRHEGLTADTVTSAVGRFFRDRRLPAPVPYSPEQTTTESGERRSIDPVSETLYQRIHVEIRDNRCRIRIDTSGSALSYRGYRVYATEAPVKENIAAALIRWAEGFSGRPAVCFDPMCGSGTFPIEAALHFYGKCPGGTREFLFQKQPYFQSGMWRHELREAATVADNSGAVLAAEDRVAIYGSDIDEEAVRAAIRNADLAGVTVPLTKSDFFAEPEGAYPFPMPHALSDRARLVFLNPPYGIRLEGAGGLYTRIAEVLMRRYAHWWVCLLVPDRLAFTELLPVGLREKILRRTVGEKHFYNGGIGVCAICLSPSVNKTLDR